MPSDIDIAQACTTVHIDKIAKDLGLSPEDYGLHGTTKAKVRTIMPGLTPLACACNCTVLFSTIKDAPIERAELSHCIAGQAFHSGQDEGQA